MTPNEPQIGLQYPEHPTTVGPSWGLVAREMPQIPPPGLQCLERLQQAEQVLRAGATGWVLPGIQDMFHQLYG